MRSFFIESLAATAVLEAWPLVQLAIPELDLAGWRRNASANLGSLRDKSRSGMLLARRGVRRQICGLVWYRSEVDLALGRILRARHLLAIDILDATPIRTALLNHLGPIARALECTTICLSTQDEGWLLSMLTHVVMPLQPHTRLDHWLDISFSTDLLCSNEAD